MPGKRNNLERLLRSAYDIQRRQETLAITNSVENRSGKPWHDTPLFLAIVSFIAVPFVYVLQSNGVVNFGWGWSSFVYVLSICIFAWAFFRWNLPNRWSPKWRAVAGTVVVVPLLSLSAWGVHSQYEKDNPPSSISIKALLSPGYPDGEDIAGIKWKKDFQNIKLVIEDTSEFPVHNLDLTVQVMPKTDDLFGGFGQLSKIDGVKFYPPEWPKGMSMTMRGIDGQKYDFNPRDLGFSLSFGGYWKMTCPVLDSDNELRLILAAYNRNAGSPKKLRVFGNLERVSKDGYQVAKFDQTIEVQR